ncbi:MAG: polymorphic toxin type 4 domain-containing protein [Pirellulales bacterium]|nr:polymorphic toxin type 4 domain-containing protein [Pirellulales bacterium]
MPVPLADGNYAEAPSADEVAHSTTHDGFNETGHIASHWSEFPDLPRTGERLQFHRDGLVRRPEPGITAIEVKLGSPAGPQNFQNFTTKGSDWGHPNHEWCHQVGAGFGVEAPYGILLAHRDVNRKIQNRGIEELIRRLQNELGKSGYDLYVNTVSCCDKVDQKLLKTMEYSVFAKDSNGSKVTLFDFSLEIQRPSSPTNPGVIPNVEFRNESARAILLELASNGYKEAFEELRSRHASDS